MGLLLAFAIGFGVVLLIVMLMASPVEGDRLGCEDDIPCQECGHCYADHINANYSNGHAYVYPRDLHR